MADPADPSSCPTEELVGAFVEGSLDGGAHAQIGAHVDGCASCRERATRTASGLGHAPPPKSSGVELAPGHVLADRYRVVRLLGRGGMGEVYEVWDLTLKVRVALKRIRPFAGDPSRLMARLRREVALGRRIHHPNVCRLYDLHVDGTSEGGALGSIFLTMELLAGETLGAALRARGRVAAIDVRRLARQMASGVAAAHAAGVILRDFKSDNVMLVPGNGEPRAVLTDFGLAVALEQEMHGDSSPSVEGAILGTFAYMAPEQVEGRPATAASDVYAIGVVLYEMLAGRLPFQGETPAKTALARLATAAPPLGALLDGDDHELDRIVMTCLARAPEDRFATADALLAALAGEVPVPAPRARLRRPRPRRAAVAALALSVAAAAGVVAFARVRSHATPHAASTIASAVGSGASSVAPIVARPALAVMPPRGHADGDGRDWLGPALEEMIRADCAHSGALRVLSSSEVREAARDLSLDLRAELGAADLTRLQRRLGIRYLVETTYVVAGSAPSQLRVDARLRDAQTGEAVAEPSRTSDSAHLIDVATGVSREIQKALKVDAPRDATPPNALPAEDERRKLYLEALAKLREGEASSARTMLEDLVKREPSFANGYAALAEACRALGDVKSAQEAARNALDRGGSTFAREERLVLEALDAELRYDGAAAEETLRALVRFYPDNLDYLLALARVQTSFGNGKGALATIAAYTPAGSVNGNDPRLELSLAETYARLGDAREERKHAEVSAALATKRGATALAALAGLELLSARVSIDGGKTVIDDYEVAAVALDKLGQPQAAMRAAVERTHQLWRAGRYEDAARSARAIRERAVASQNRLFEGKAEQLLGLALQLSDRTAAYAAHEASLRIFREIGDKRAMLNPIVSLGILDERVDDLAKSTSRFEQARELAHAVGSRREEARALSNLADAYYRTMHLDRVNEVLRAARPVREEIGDRTGVAYITMLMARSENESGDLARAEALESESRQIYASLKDGSGLGNLGLVTSTTQTLRADFAGARASLDDVVKEYERENAEEFVASALLEIAALDVEHGLPNSALARSAGERGRAKGSLEFACEGASTLAASLALESKWKDAAAQIVAADLACTHLQAEITRIRAAFFVAEALNRLGRRDEARARLDWAIERTEATGFRVLGWLGRVRRLETIQDADWRDEHEQARAALEANGRATGVELIVRRSLMLKRGDGGSPK